MTRDEAREALYKVVEKYLPGGENIEARLAIGNAAIDFASAAAHGAIDGVIANMQKNLEGKR